MLLNALFFQKTFTYQQIHKDYHSIEIDYQKNLLSN